MPLSPPLKVVAVRTPVPALKVKPALVAGIFVPSPNKTRPDVNGENGFAPMSFHEFATHCLSAYPSFASVRRSPVLHVAGTVLGRRRTRSPLSDCPNASDVRRMNAVSAAATIISKKLIGFIMVRCSPGSRGLSCPVRVRTGLRRLSSHARRCRYL